MAELSARELANLPPGKWRVAAAYEIHDVWGEGAKRSCIVTRFFTAERADPEGPTLSRPAVTAEQPAPDATRGGPERKP